MEKVFSSYLLWQTCDRWHAHHGAENVLGMIASGYTVDKIVTSYPELGREDVVAAVEYAANVVDEVQVIAR